MLKKVSGRACLSPIYRLVALLLKIGDALLEERYLSPLGRGTVLEQRIKHIFMRAYHERELLHY